MEDQGPSLDDLIREAADDVRRFDREDDPWPEPSEHLTDEEARTRHDERRRRLTDRLSQLIAAGAAAVGPDGIGVAVDEARQAVDNLQSAKIDAEARGEGGRAEELGDDISIAQSRLDALVRRQDDLAKLPTAGDTGHYDDGHGGVDQPRLPPPGDGQPPMGDPVEQPLVAPGDPAPDSLAPPLPPPESFGPHGSEDARGADRSGPTKRTALSVLAVAAIVATVSIALAAAKVGPFASSTHASRPSQPTPPAAETPTSAAESTNEFYPPVLYQVPASLLDLTKAVTAPIEATTDPNGFGSPVAAAYGANGMLLHESGFVFRLDPAAEDSWPPNVSGSDNFAGAFFLGHAGAVAVEQASEANLLGNGFHRLSPPDIARQGIDAFEGPPSAAGNITQIWYVVSDNVFKAIADTGKFPPGTLRPQEKMLLDAIEGQLRPVANGPSSPLSQAQALQSYLSAVAPVNAAASPFTDQERRFDASTANAQAQTAAQPLVSALNDVESQLGAIAGGYPSAEAVLYADYAAVEVLKGDLSNLSRLDKLGVSAWRERYEADLAKLTATSNQVRAALGGQPARSS